MHNNSIKLIGLHGPAGCGKDTVAKILCKTQEFRRISFADPLIDMLADGFRVPRNYFTDRNFKDRSMAEFCGKSPRYMMQTLGTEWGRNTVDVDIWVKIAGRKIDYLKQLAATKNAYIEGIVATDVRFQNECDYVRDQGGEIWYILRPSNPYRINTGHGSETGVNFLSGKEITIVNDGDIAQLAEKINQILHPTI